MSLKVEQKNYEYTANKVSVAKTDTKNSIWETNINGEIEDTEQSEVTGDCWLLTNLNCLRDTKWGKEMIKNSIQSDGNGGVIITFKGAKTKAKKFHISAKAIVQARQSGIYSKGDDDVIAMELAVEKYLKMYRNQEGKKPGEAIDGNGINLSAFVELLSGEQTNLHYVTAPRSNLVKECERAYKEKLRILEEIEKHPGEYAVMVSFIGNTLDGIMISEHAYQVQKVITEQGKKYVILVNPHKSSEKIKIELEKFIPYIDIMHIVETPGAKPNHNIKGDFERERVLYELLLELMNKQIRTRGDIDKNVDLEKFKELIELVDESNIKHLFSDKYCITLIITICDQLKYGLGNGKEKKALIAPLVDAYCEYAKNQGVPEDIADDVKKSCYNELDAKFYTNEDVIIEKLQMLFDEIEKAKENNPLKRMFDSTLKDISFGL